ncbi:endoribonuclease MazF [Neisseria weixii]|uniref:Endoribonuclease MazF n=1 Tax=Neisseria weixii TaxID=1853276 RepID=A0A3N4MJ15_9NEIS|nr:endoribonuclease MazF [Neisseria weixii]RPD83045.1 endoribonuclease MazF [Neisseria weixii]RPD83215.1 endoribonuclease MazF [Neisseria weixii]
MSKNYIPDVGDIIWLNFTPQAGHEQAGHRPAVVLTPKAYNKNTGLLICCPLTTQVKGYPFEVNIDGSRKNVALSDQVKSLDWRIRQAVFKGKVSDSELEEIRAKISVLIGLGNL